jgi:hypothetical protein
LFWIPTEFKFLLSFLLYILCSINQFLPSHISYFLQVFHSSPAILLFDFLQHDKGFCRKGHYTHPSSLSRCV